MVNKVPWNEWSDRKGLQGARIYRLMITAEITVYLHRLKRLTSWGWRPDQQYTPFGRKDSFSL